MKYIVAITEVLSRQIEVEANSEEEAEIITRKMYKDQEVVLDCDDHQQTEFEVFKKIN